MEDRTINAPAAGEPDPAGDESFRPDWRLSPSAALATHIRLAMHRRGISCAGNLDTDEQWEMMALEVINGLRRDAISPCQIVELPRTWERK
jgi:hypothetical protein